MFGWSRASGSFDCCRPDPQFWAPGILITRFPSQSFTNWTGTNAAISGNSVFLTTASPAILSQSLLIPDDAYYLDFDFRWLAKGGNDRLTLHFGDRLLFSFDGNLFEGTAFENSGLIALEDFRGLNNSLIFTLNSDRAGARLELTNFAFSSAATVVNDATNAVPEPSTIVLFLSGIVIVALCQLRRKTAPVWCMEMEYQDL